MNNKYILKDGEPVLCDDPLEWGLWFGVQSNRVVRQTKVGPHHVSTMFIGLDHNFSGGGLPVLWETMVFPAQDHTRRYTSAEDAIKGHLEVCSELLRELSENKSDKTSELKSG